jgi:hypothetical protein
MQRGLPRSPVSKGLKMPRSKGSDQISNRLKKKSPWYQSLLDPMHGAECKIPDSTGVETGTIQGVTRVPITVNAAGVAGLRTTCLYPNFYAAGPYCENYQIFDAVNSTATDINWDPAVQNFDACATLQDFANSVRIVSAALYCQSMASLSSNGGLYTGYINPYDEVLTSDPSEITDLQNIYKSALIPINNNEPIVVRWYPIKQSGWAYDMFYNTQQAATGPESPPLQEMGLVISGSTPGAVFEVTIVVNYEYIPKYNAINIIDASPSPVDAMETDLVENWVQDMDVVQMTNNRKLATSPSSVTPSHEDDSTGFGMFFNVIAELAPLALALL